MLQLFLTAFSPLQFRQILDYPADAGPSASHTHHHLFCHHKCHCQFIGWQFEELFLDEDCHLTPPTQAPPTSPTVVFLLSFFPKLAHRAVTQRVLLWHAAGWRCSGHEKSLKNSQLSSLLLCKNFLNFFFSCIHEELIPALPLGEFHSCISQLPSNPKFLYPVPGLKTALENCFLTGKLGVEVNSFTLTARGTEELKHLEQKWVLGVIRSHQMHMSQNCLHKTIDPCLTNLLLFAFYFLYFQWKIPASCISCKFLYFQLLPPRKFKKDSKGILI